MILQLILHLTPLIALIYFSEIWFKNRENGEFEESELKSDEEESHINLDDIKEVIKEIEEARKRAEERNNERARHD